MGEPANILHGPCTVSIDGNNVGYTRGGVTLTSQNDKMDIEADQATGVIKKPTIMQKMFVKFAMLEGTVANMITAMEGTAAGSGDVSFGVAEPITDEHTLTLVGQAPSVAGVAKTRTYTFHRAVISDSVEHMVGARDAVGEIPVTFELLKDPSNGTTFGYFVDAT